MSRIRARDTRPEIVMRSLLHAAGYRFRLHEKSLPGTPDLVLRKYNSVVFVNGCFWHRHRNCKLSTTPRSNVDFWQRKFALTVERDKRTAESLKQMGWNVITVWECELENDAEAVIDSVCNALKEGLGE